MTAGPAGFGAAAARVFAFWTPPSCWPSVGPTKRPTPTTPNPTATAARETIIAPPPWFWPRARPETVDDPAAYARRRALATPVLRRGAAPHPGDYGGPVP